MKVRHINQVQVNEAILRGTREPSFKGREAITADIADFQLTVVTVQEGDATIVITAYRNPPWEEGA